MTDTPRPSPEDAAADREDGTLKKPDAAAQEAIERATAAVGSDEPPVQGGRDGE
ncbi:hypothetical protein [Methylorubrum sp. SB2]|uniref:hypothetical protein n=1 Tax=Methylorubrum subtropicum TaxID=3138812 RepID=UPI00313F18B2